MRKVAGYSALVMFLGGIAACPFSVIGQGKGHNFGPLILGFYLWVFAGAAAVVFLIASATARRAAAAGDGTTRDHSTAG